MAARRLIAILIVLLVISSFAAALAPQRDPEQTESSTTTTTTTRMESMTDPSRRFEEIPAAPQEPVTIAARPGDQLTVTVAVNRPTDVEIPTLGRRAFATPRDAARFDLLLRAEGRFPIMVGGETVGRLEVDGTRPSGTMDADERSGAGRGR